MKPFYPALFLKLAELLNFGESQRRVRPSITQANENPEKSIADFQIVTEAALSVIQDWCIDAGLRASALTLGKIIEGVVHGQIPAKVFAQWEPEADASAMK